MGIEVGAWVGFYTSGLFGVEFIRNEPNRNGGRMSTNPTGNTKIFRDGIMNLNGHQFGRVGEVVVESHDGLYSAVKTPSMT